MQIHKEITWVEIKHETNVTYKNISQIETKVKIVSIFHTIQELKNAFNICKF